MQELTKQEIHEKCIENTQLALIQLNKGTIFVGTLSDADKSQLRSPDLVSTINWQWGMNTYAGGAEDGILDISLKLVDYANPEQIQAVIILKYDARRNELSICMIENFLRGQKTDLDGWVFIVSLIYSTTFCEICNLDEVYIQHPIPEAVSYYRSYGFYFLAGNDSKMSASIDDILASVREKVDSLD